MTVVHYRTPLKATSDTATPRHRQAPSRAPVAFRPRRVPRKGVKAVSFGLAGRLPISQDKDADGNGMALAGRVPAIVCYLKTESQRATKQANYWLDRLNVGLEILQELYGGAVTAVRVYGPAHILAGFLKAGERFDFLNVSECHPAENGREPRQGQGSGPEKVRALRPSAFARAAGDCSSHRVNLAEQQRAAQHKRQHEAK